MERWASMLLKKLRMKNIRTYEDWEVTFPPGAILFEGSVGSGKSTLLLAVEFALFGLGNEKGTTLLGLGKNLGEVELEFIVHGEEVHVHRSLVRTKKSSIDKGIMTPGGVKQDDCWLEYGGHRISYSPKEMKEAILKKLGYNEPFDPKAKSLIFRYAVYTPQEEMKDILSQPPEQRIQTLRKAFRLEEYRIARDNAHRLSKLLEYRAKFLLESIKLLPEIDAELERVEAGIPKVEYELGEMEERIAEEEAALSGCRSDRDLLQSKLEELAGGAKKSAELSRSLADTVHHISSLRSNINSTKDKIGKMRLRMGETQEKLSKASMTSAEAEGLLQRARSDFAERTEALGQANQLYRSYAQLMKMKICPTCRRPIDTDADKFNAEMGGVARSREKISTDLIAIEKRMKELERIRQSAEAFESNSQLVTELEDGIYDNENRVVEDEKSLEMYEGQRRDLEDRIRDAEKAASMYKDAKAEYDRNESEIASLEGKLDGFKVERSRAEARIEQLRHSLEELLGQKKEIEGKKSRAESLGEYCTWLEGFFEVAMERIERSILTTANRELNEELGRWFAFLVEDPTKAVRIDEDFTPLVTQDAYEQDVSNLSGGERNALALAYRLALNRTVQRRAGIDAGLLILDEPTDGFSKDQIGKIGELLKELELAQVIIVSHERELEGAVDHIFRVNKEHGRSEAKAVT